MTRSALDSLVEPAYRSVPAHVETFGPEVVDICRMAGFMPDPEQEQCLDAMFAVDARGKTAAFEFGIVCPRQNMKTGLLKMAVLGWLFVTEQRLIVWSAHEMKTTKEAFRDLEDLIKGCPELRSRLAPTPTEGIYHGNGEESIELATGQRVMFKARTHGGGRGLTGDKVILDEAMYLEASHMGSLIPTMAARPDPQVCYAASAGLQKSEELRGVRDRGRSGTDPSLAYFEWASERGGCATEDCAHELTAQSCALDDESKWAQANPALGRRIELDTLRAMRRTLSASPMEFAREFLSWWDDPPEGGVDPVVDMAQWAKLADRTATVDGPVALAVAIPRDRSSSTVSVSWLHGERVFSAVTRLPGTSKAVELIRRKLDEHEVLDVSLHAGGPAGALVADLEAEGIEVTTVSTQEFAQATGAYRDGIANSEVGHVDQAELTDSLRNARLRNAGDGEMWDQRDELSDSAPVVAVTLSTRGFIKNAPVEYDVLESIG